MSEPMSGKEFAKQIAELHAAFQRKIKGAGNPLGKYDGLKPADATGAEDAALRETREASAAALARDKQKKLDEEPDDSDVEPQGREQEIGRQPSVKKSVSSDLHGKLKDAGFDIDRTVKNFDDWEIQHQLQNAGFDLGQLKENLEAISKHEQWGSILDEVRRREARERLMDRGRDRGFEYER